MDSLLSVEITSKDNEKKDNSEDLLNDSIIIDKISENDKYVLKKKIINNSKGLKKIEYIQILKIINKYNINFMENINGIFINLNNIEYNILKEIDILIDYIKCKNKELENTEKLLKKKRENIENMNKIEESL